MGGSKRQRVGGRVATVTPPRLVVKMSNDVVYDPNASDRPKGVGIYPADGEVQIRNISGTVVVGDKLVDRNQTEYAGPGVRVQLNGQYGRVVVSRG
jgi:hypothetical protein